MQRRAFLTLSCAGFGSLAGCQSRPSEPDTSNSFSESTTGSNGGVNGAAGTPTTAPRPPADRSLIFVGPDGRAGAAGSESDPLGSIQNALEHAAPGDTVSVLPGEYREHVSPPRGGTPDRPITLTGPPEAVLRAPTDYYLVEIEWSHVHLTGLTLTGLTDPTRPGDPDAYNDGGLVFCRPRTSTEDYLRDIVLKPHRIGNSASALIQLNRTRNAEIGEFVVDGVAGASYTVGDERDHVGEIVYLGTAPDNLGTDWHPWTEPDRTRDVRVHHIDNSAGHDHAELVDIKQGAESIWVEYCTDRGAYVTEEMPASGVALRGTNCTVRWNELTNARHTERGYGFGIHLRGPEGVDDAYPAAGTGNAIYWNRLGGNADGPFLIDGFAGDGVDAQRRLCGNHYEPDSEPSFAKSCPGDVPSPTDGIGHAGGSGD